FAFILKSTLQNAIRQTHFSPHKLARSTSMSSSRPIGLFLPFWLALIAIYAAMSLLLPQGSQPLSTFGNLVQCLVPLVANGGLLLNAGTPHLRRNIFWMLLALSCTLWMIGQFQWTYYEVYAHRPMPAINGGDVIFFLRGIPLMAALALQPHRKRGEVQLRFGYLDFLLLLTWWTFLYAYVVSPWMYAVPSEGQYNFNYDVVSNVQNMIIIVWLAWLWLRTKGPWRTVYAHLFGGSALYMLSSLSINVAISGHRYSTGSLYDIPLISSFLWFWLAGLIAYQHRGTLDAPDDNGVDLDSSDRSRSERTWASRLAMAVVISLPLFAIYTMRYEHNASEVRDFRLLVTLVASVLLAL